MTRQQYWIFEINTVLNSFGYMIIIKLKNKEDFSSNGGVPPIDPAFQQITMIDSGQNMKKIYYTKALENVRTNLFLCLFGHQF